MHETTRVSRLRVRLTIGTPRPRADSWCLSLWRSDSFAEVHPIPPRSRVPRRLAGRRGRQPSRPSRAAASRRAHIASVLARSRSALEDVEAGAVASSSRCSTSEVRRWICDSNYTVIMKRIRHAENNGNTFSKVYIREDPLFPSVQLYFLDSFLQLLNLSFLRRGHLRMWRRSEKIYARSPCKIKCCNNKIRPYRLTKFVKYFENLFQLLINSCKIYVIKSCNQKVGQINFAAIYCLFLQLIYYWSKKFSECFTNPDLLQVPFYKRDFLFQRTLQEFRM